MVGGVSYAGRMNANLWLEVDVAYDVRQQAHHLYLAAIQLAVARTLIDNGPSLTCGQ